MDSTFETLLKAIRLEINADSTKQLALLCKEYNTVFQNLVGSDWVSSDCSDILFVNITPLATVNGDIGVNNYPLQPGGFIGFMGNNAEINKTQYNVVFNTGAIQMWVFKKLYTK